MLCIDTITEIIKIQMSVMDCLPIGYKRTPLGVIPQEWEVLPLSVAFRIQGGYAFKSELFSTTGDIPVIRISNLPQNSRFVELSECVYYPSHIEICSQFTIHKGDLLIAMSGATTGKTAIFNKSFNAYLNQRVGVFRQTTNKILYSYLLSIIHSTLFKYKLQPLLIAGAQPNISSNDIENMKFAIPPIQEQKKIAELLSEWDKAIELQTKLIEELELRKRALMQRLLTGRVRLNGFSDKWKKKRLSEIGVFLSSNTLSRDKLNKIGGHIQNIHYGDILIHYPTIINPAYTPIPYVNKDVIVNSDLLQDGDIVFADTAEDYTVGKAIEIVNVSVRQIVAGLHTIPFRPNKGLYAKQFLGYYINSASYQKQLRALTQGIKVCSISKSSIKNTYLQIPSLAEQSVIAEVLMSADAEIKIAKTKLSSLRNQKRGLMQQLLTGKKRIK